MAFLPNIFKRKIKNNAEGMPQKVADVVTESRVEQSKDIQSPALSGILLAPHITEKTSNAVKKNTYVFLVSKSANKIDVARAVRGRFHVPVRAVNIINTPGKERRRGRQIGWKPGFKKAMVTLREGHTIEVQ